MAPGLDDLEIMKFKVAAYNKTKGRMTFVDEKSDESDFMRISGTRMRQWAKCGEKPPTGFMVESAWNVLANHYKNDDA